MRTRGKSRVPRAALALIAAGLLAQVALRGPGGAPEARDRALPQPPARPLLRVAALGDPRLFSRLLMLWLLTFERHAGAGVPLASLDYDALRTWLARILELDPGYSAPLRAAARVYAGVASPEKKRTMLDFVHERFPEDPGRRWPWLVFAVVEARHRMGDAPLALRYARTLGASAAGAGVPAWARDLGAGVLAELGGPAAGPRGGGPRGGGPRGGGAGARAGEAAPRRRRAVPPAGSGSARAADRAAGRPERRAGGPEAAPGPSRSRDAGAAAGSFTGRIAA